MTVDCETNYPFEDVLSYSITAEKPLDFYVRQPTWASGATLSQQSSFDSETGLHKISLPAGASTFTYIIETAVRTEPRANDTVAVYRGQLLYAAEISAKVTSTGPHAYHNETLYPANYAPPQARDYTMINTTEWNIAIDPSTIIYHPRAAQATSYGQGAAIDPLPTPIFASGAPPMYMTVQSCLIDWPLFMDSVPGSPIPKSERKCLSEAFETKLVPYGSAKVRMTELPTIDL